MFYVDKNLVYIDMDDGLRSEANNDASHILWFYQLAQDIVSLFRNLMKSYNVMVIWIMWDTDNSLLYNPWFLCQSIKLKSLVYVTQLLYFL
jgi:hypothetical protein